jgi:hypothetical protein
MRATWLPLALAFALTACGYEAPPTPPAGYVGSIDMDGRDLGKNHYGDPQSRGQCAIEPNGSTRLSFVVGSRLAGGGKFRFRQTQTGSIVLPAPGAEPRYEVDLPWSHLLFDASECNKTEVQANASGGEAKIDCRDASRGDVLTVDVDYQGC